jgi:hypothetical protein
MGGIFDFGLLGGIYVASPRIGSQIGFSVDFRDILHPSAPSSKLCFIRMFKRIYCDLLLSKGGVHGVQSGSAEKCSPLCSSGSHSGEWICSRHRAVSSTLRRIWYAFAQPQSERGYRAGNNAGRANRRFGRPLWRILGLHNLVCHFADSLHGRQGCLAKEAWDPDSFILLNLFLSMLAAVQAPGHHDEPESPGHKRSASR